MMAEIEKNGPIVVSFEPDEGFISYKSGILINLRNLC